MIMKRVLTSWVEIPGQDEVESCYPETIPTSGHVVWTLMIPDMDVHPDGPIVILWYDTVEEMAHRL